MTTGPAPLISGEDAVAAAAGKGAPGRSQLRPFGPSGASLAVKSAKRRPEETLVAK